MVGWCKWPWKGGTRWVCPAESLPLFSLYSTSFPLPQGSWGSGCGHRHHIKASWSVLPLGSHSVLELGVPWDCFTPVPQTICESHRNHPGIYFVFIWHDLALSLQEGNIRGIGKAVQKWIRPGDSRERLFTWCLAPALSLPLNSFLPEKIKGDIMGPFSPSKHPGNGGRSVMLSPSVLSCSFCLARGALANPVYFFIFHSWWCIWNANWCHGKWAVVEAHRDLGLCRHWWILQVRRVKELLSSYLKVPQNTMPRMNTPTEVSCRRHVYLYYEYSLLLVLKNSCNFPHVRIG